MKFWLTALCPRRVPSEYCKVCHKSRLGTRQQLWDCDEKWSICCIAQLYSHLCPQGLPCRLCDLLFFFNDVGLEKRLLFFHSPDTRSMRSLLPSLQHYTFFQLGCSEGQISRVTALEVKQHQAIPEGLLLPNPPIENRVADNLHFLVLNFPYYTLSYCLYLHKGGLRSPSSLLHTHCPRVTNKGQRGCSLASLLIFQHQSQASRIHFLLLPVASSLASHHSHYKSEINNPALGYFHIILM